MTDVDTGASIFHDGAYDRENPIRRCLDDMLHSCEQEEQAAMQKGFADRPLSDDDSPLADFGPIMLYVLEHHILEQVCTAGKSDLPLGMKALALRALSRAATHTRHPLLLHPTTRNSIAELVALSSPALPPVFYSTSPTNVIASMGASPTAASCTPTSTAASSGSGPSAAPQQTSSTVEVSSPPARVARRVRLALAVQEHLLSLLSAIWGHATAEPALVASLEHAASGLAQYRTPESTSTIKIAVASAPISLWLRGVLGLLASPQADVAQAAADVLLTVLMVRDASVVNWLKAAQHVIAACIAGAVAEAWDAVVAPPLPLATLPGTEWGSLARRPDVQRLLSALRCATVFVDLCSGRHPRLAACVGSVLDEHVLQQRMIAAISAPATQEHRASQCVLLQLTAGQLAASSGAAPLRLAPGDTATAPAAAALASLLRGLLVGQPLMNVVEAVRRGPAYLTTAASFLLADVCVLSQEVCPETVLADETCLPKEFEQHPLTDIAELLNDTLTGAQTRLWELTRQSSGTSGSSVSSNQPQPGDIQAAIDFLLSADSNESSAAASQLVLSPGRAGSDKATHVAAPSTPQPAAAVSDATPAVQGFLPSRSVVVAAFKMHVVILSALARWFDPERSVDANIALSGLLTAALHWHPTRILLLGSKKRPAADVDGAVEDHTAAAPPVSCSVVTALRVAWSKALSTATEQTRSMGRTPFQAALLSRKLRMGLPGATCDDGDSSEVAVLARSAVAGTADAAVQSVLSSAAEQLDKLIILDEVSNECRTTVQNLMAESSL